MQLLHNMVGLLQQLHCIKGPSLQRAHTIVITSMARCKGWEECVGLIAL